MASPSFHAAVIEVETDTQIPDRVQRTGLVELAEAFGASVGDDDDVWAALHDAWAPMDTDVLGEKLLDLVLLHRHLSLDAVARQGPR